MHKRIKQRELPFALNNSKQGGGVQSCVKRDNDARMTAVKLQIKHARCCLFIIRITFINTVIILHF